MLPILNPVPAHRFVTVQYDGPDCTNALHRTVDRDAAANWIACSIYDLSADDQNLVHELVLSTIELAWGLGIAITLHMQDESSFFIQPGFHGLIPGFDPDKMAFYLDEDWMAMDLGVTDWTPLVQF
jgi:hypothetical protein